MAKSVLLTGIAGFMGSHVLDHLLVNTDWDITGLASFRHRGIPERIADSEHYREHRDRVTILTCDLTAPVTGITKLRAGHPDYIIHAAADSHVDRSVSDPVPFIRNNTEVTLNMLELARELKPGKFIQVSTDEVYGPVQDGLPHAEWSAILPSNPYSASKACQEAIAISYWRTYGVPVIITNTMNLFGERQDPEKFIPKTIRAIMRGETVTVHGVPGDIGSRFYIHARSQADALLFILENVAPAMFPGAGRPVRLNVVGERRISNLAMAGILAEALGLPLKYRLEDFHSTRPGHDPHYGLDGTLLASLGWRPPVEFTESLKRMVSWYAADPSRMRMAEWLGY